MPEPTRHGEATIAEARAAIEGLSDPDHAKLMLVARGLRRARLRGDTVAPEDLLQEAFAKTLQGARVWNRSVSMLKHLAEVMRSDSSHEAERRSKWPMRSLEGTLENLEEEGYPARSSTALEDRDEFERVLRLFETDDVALRLLRLKGEGYSASEIQRELGIGKVQYETVLKRIRRALAKTLADGGK
jgi:DNA-directed RNA polymerase specialized sigma24 family protein